jgi:hypothetical protein
MSYIIVTGNPIEGLTFTGPFLIREDAIEYAQRMLPSWEYWWIGELYEKKEMK